MSLTLPRWSTPSVLGLGLLLSGPAYWAGRVSGGARTQAAAARSSPAPANQAEAVRLMEAGGRPGPLERAVAAESPEERWSKLAAAPRTPGNAREMAAFLEELATREPKRALALALAEKNHRIREKLRNAVLVGWAGSEPDAAAAWALGLPEHDRPTAMESVFTGAGSRPEEAARFGERLFAQNPAFASSYGQMLVTALTDAGAYETAARFASAGDTENHRAWLSATFYQWAANQPDQATAALAAITDPAEHAEAFDAYVLGWAGSDGSGLAAYAMKMPPGPDRAKALGQALDQWVAQDTVGAAEFIGRLNSSPDLDGGIASVATSLNMVSQWPELAAGLAESIGDSALRGRTLSQVARHWEERRPGAVRRFLDANTSELRPEDLAALQSGLLPAQTGKGAPWAIAK